MAFLTGYPHFCAASAKFFRFFRVREITKEKAPASPQAFFFFILSSYPFHPNLPKGPPFLKQTNEKHPRFLAGVFPFISNFLSSQAASSQVLSAFMSLTTVFGMGTGVSS